MSEAVAPEPATRLLPGRWPDLKQGLISLTGSSDTTGIARRGISPRRDTKDSAPEGAMNPSRADLLIPDTAHPMGMQPATEQRVSCARRRTTSETHAIQRNAAGRAARCDRRRAEARRPGH